MHHADDVVADIAPAVYAGQHSAFDDIPDTATAAAVQIGKDDAVAQLDSNAAASIDPQDRTPLGIHKNDAARGPVNDV